MTHPKAVAPTEPKPSGKASMVYAALRQKILEGAYKPGDRLRLAPLAREMSLSEMPVREALRLLQKEGLVVIHLHRGAEIARHSVQRGRDVTEARMTLERRAALDAMPFHDSASVEELERLVEAMAAAAARPERFGLRHRAFCTALLAPGPNGFMTQLIQDFWDQVWQASSTAVFELMLFRVAETVEESRLIVAHVAAGDARKLDAVMNERLERTMAAWRAVVAAGDAPGPARRARLDGTT